VGGNETELIVDRLSSEEPIAKPTSEGVCLFYLLGRGGNAYGEMKVEGWIRIEARRIKWDIN